jgi:hypothetical protein
LCPTEATLPTPRSAEQSRQELTWFLSRWGVAPCLAQELDEAIGGRFASWTGPDIVLVEDVAERLALSLRPDDGPQSAGPAPDHLERWLAVRETVPRQDLPDGAGNEPVAPSRDGVAQDIRAFDTRRSFMQRRLPRLTVRVVLDEFLDMAQQGLPYTLR